jgi:hypothetical protein
MSKHDQLHDPEARLTRAQIAQALTAAGFPTSAATLATMATRGGGPPFEKYGPRAIYRLSEAMAWAKARLTKPACKPAAAIDAAA